MIADQAQFDRDGDGARSAAAGSPSHAHPHAAHASIHPPAQTPPPAPAGEIFDALADLFLGELSPQQAHGLAVGVLPVGRPRGEHARVEPTTTGPGPAESGVTHAAGPAPAAAHGPDGAEKTGLRPDQGGDREAINAGGARAGGTIARVGEPAPLTVEALVLGHLPVLGSAWASEYARHVARGCGGPVALLRLRAGHARVEFIGGKTATASDGAAAGAGSASVHRALSQVRRSARSVVIHCDAAHEPAVACAAGVRAVELLTGADDASVVAAYRMLRVLAPRFEARGVDQPRVRLVVMGAAESRARAVWERVQDAASTFLGLAVEAGACLPRIGAGQAGAVIFEGPVLEDPADLVALLTDPRQADEADEADDAQRAGEALTHTADADARPDSTAAAAAEKGRRGAAPRADLVDSDLDGDDPDQRAAAPVPSADQPAAACLLEPERAPAELSLAELVPGLTALAARCPHAEHVELAVDGQGRLHALAHDEEPGRGVEHLTAVAAWAGLHHRLIAMTLPRACVAAPCLGEGAVLHLFTPAPTRHRALLDSGVRVHLLARAERVRRGDWVCAALN